MQSTSREEIKSVNGIQLYVVSEGTGVPLVVVHGAAALGHYYTRPLLDALAKEFQVIAYDQRGSGRFQSAAFNLATLLSSNSNSRTQRLMTSARV